MTAPFCVGKYSRIARKGFDLCIDHSFFLLLNADCILKNDNLILFGHFIISILSYNNT